jgi:hypothetical protein
MCIGVDTVVGDIEVAGNTEVDTAEVDIFDRMKIFHSPLLTSTRFLLMSEQ